jgi:hypothetical protein
LRVYPSPKTIYNVHKIIRFPRKGKVQRKIVKTLGVSRALFTVEEKQRSKGKGERLKARG